MTIVRFFYKDTFIRLNVHECFACTYMCTPHACLMSIQPTRWLGLRMVKSHCANAETGTQVLCRATSPPQFSAQPLPIKKRKGRERLGQKMVNDKKAFKQYQQAPKLWHMTKRCIFEMSWQNALRTWDHGDTYVCKDVLRAVVNQVCKKHVLFLLRVYYLK